MAFKKHFHNVAQLGGNTKKPNDFLQTDSQGMIFGFVLWFVNLLEWNDLASPLELYFVTGPSILIGPGVYLTIINTGFSLFFLSFYAHCFSLF